VSSARGVLRFLSDEEWDSFVAASAAPSVFQTSAWGEVVRSIGQYPYRVSVRDKTGKLAAVALLIRRRTNAILSILGLNRATVSWGPVGVQEEYLGPVLHRLVDEGKRLGISEILITSDVFEPPAFPSAGFHQVDSELNSEIVVDLARPLEDVWKSLDKDCRSAVKKAERDGVQVVEGGCNDFYEVYLSTRERLKARRTPKSFFKAIEDLMVTKDMASFLVAKLGDRNIAAIIMLRFGDIAWYYEGVSDDRFWIHRANNLLQWRAIELAARRKLRLYNMTQTPSSENKESLLYGLYKFKSQFGGELRPLRTFRFTTRTYDYVGRLVYRAAELRPT
jgi:lipid II:glycine glycyltransferase (peptidoglycan interpeptide bridge formation enzyme)